MLQSDETITVQRLSQSIVAESIELLTVSLVGLCVLLFPLGSHFLLGSC